MKSAYILVDKLKIRIEILYAIRCISYMLERIEKENVNFILRCQGN